MTAGGSDCIGSREALRRVIRHRLIHTWRSCVYLPVTPPPPHDLTRLADEDLVALIADGDAQAFEVLYDRHARGAYSLAYRLLGNRDAAEDLVQDAFLGFWRGGVRYSPARGSVRSFLLAIVHNRGVDRLRTAGAMVRRQEALRSMEERRPPAPDAQSEAIDAALGADIRTELAGMPDEQEQVLRLAYYGGFTHHEIAAMLDLPLGTVKGRMRLGLDRLRRSLGVTEGTA